MNYVQLDYKKYMTFINHDQLEILQDEIYDLHHKLHNEAQLGHSSLGWIDYPNNYDSKEIEKIKSIAEKVRGNSDIFLVIGIGGSYLGARAAIEMLTHSFHNHLRKDQRTSPAIFFVGNNLSTVYISDLIELLEHKDFSINVVSKSGETLEPAIAFRIFRKILYEKYGEEEARSRIYVTTDRKKGLLQNIARVEGYETFGIPEDIGGRFSVLTPVGLFPIAVSGICIDEILRGASVASYELRKVDIRQNPAYEYAAIRNVLYQEGKVIELMVSYEPKFKYFSEWWKQLYAESEGKDQKGIFPTSAIYSTDLHSIGQYVQEGTPHLFETIIKENNTKKEIFIEEEQYNLDNLNYLSGKTVDFIKEQAYVGTLDAHSNGGIPNIVIRVPNVDSFIFGYLIYFFQKSCAMSGYLLGVNPFNQPGVEAYKKNMLSLLKNSEYEMAKMN